MGSEDRTGLLIDYGGVLTSDLFASFASFCVAEGLEPSALAGAFRRDLEARRLLIDFETGRLGDEEFERSLGAILGVDPESLIDRLFAGSRPDEAMLAAVRAARRAGIRTGLISNSWGTSRYDRDLLAELFDGVVLSGEVGIRKPALEIYQLGAERIGLPPEACVFVDDLAFNLAPAAELGMATVHHVDAERTVAELELLLGVAFRAP
jgi:epoxide hydrolase-like predicted phosphatase